METWTQTSPKLLKELKQYNMAEELAFVAQERMWQKEEALQASGMAYPDSLPRTIWLSKGKGRFIFQPCR